MAASPRTTTKENEHGNCPDPHSLSHPDAYADPHSDPAEAREVIQAALYAAMSCAVISALTGNRTAWLLLASAAFCLALGAWGIAFHFVYWMLVDFVVVMFIVRPKMTNADCVILALFIPAWVFYLLPPEPRYNGTALIVIFQLLLTFPFANTGQWLKRIRLWKGDPPHRDLRAVHAFAGA